MCGTWIFSHFFRDGHFLSRTALCLCFLPFNFPLSKPYRKNTHLALMVRNFLGQWKDKMLLPGSVAALGRQGNMLSPAYGWAKLLQDWTVCSWSQVMSVARIKNQMFLANPGNHYPSSSWDHQGKCQSFLETRAGTARPKAEPHSAGGRFHTLGHLQLFSASLWHGWPSSQGVREGTARKERLFPSKEENASVESVLISREFSEMSHKNGLGPALMSCYLHHLLFLLQDKS